MRKLEASMMLALLLGGCASAPAAQHLRLADVGKGGGGIDWSRPIVLELQPGDQLPIRMTFSDQLFDLSPAAPPIALVAKRHGFVRVDAKNGRITTSLTGADFEEKPAVPGSFHVGLALTRQGSWVDVGVTTPRHAEPK